ncbi:MAG: DUF5043 domain-containing protein [Alistipes sp.]|nr:DUF5043 domain-containing protein [Alistipes sp.]
MKKHIIIAIVLLASSLQAMAQRDSLSPARQYFYKTSQVSYSVAGGVRFRTFKGKYQYIVENMDDKLFGRPLVELSGAPRSADKEYDWGQIDGSQVDAALNATFSRKERCLFGKDNGMLIIEYVLDGNTGDVLEVAFSTDNIPAFTSLPLTKFVLLTENVKKHMKARIAEPAEYRMRYIEDAIMYHFPTIPDLDENSAGSAGDFRAVDRDIEWQ